MKNIAIKPFLITALAVVAGLVAYNVGSTQLAKMKTTPPATTTEGA